MREGWLHASNTDAYGFMTHLVARGARLEQGQSPVMVLGAGGAARAIRAWADRGGRVEDPAREPHRRAGEALAKAFGPRVAVIPWEDRNKALAGCGLLVNATSLGMTGKPPLDIDLSALPFDAIVADIVYSPLETPLLAAARARGNRTVDGLGMLLHQAVPASSAGSASGQR